MTVVHASRWEKGVYSVLLCHLPTWAQWGQVGGGGSRRGGQRRGSWCAGASKGQRSKTHGRLWRGRGQQTLIVRLPC